MLDTSLEVVVDGEVGYIEGNAHTFPGRMHIYLPGRGYDVTRSLCEIDSMSDASRWWIKGFLAGCEPDISAYLGIDLIEDDSAEATAEEYERWQAFNARCRDTGCWPQLNKRPRTPLIITPEEKADLRVEGELRPWAMVGERVWVPAGATWVEAAPQPQLVSGFMPGTVCAERREDDVLHLDSGWTICVDCGEVAPPD
ncbi:hypothetical protein [Nocardioides sp. Iso805N]|uniref:hypothetical protein n=1 Tax=Nocardioides sp. Iso805N TaxID=1283287 RepID=UPI00036BBFEC|nr:hypothetical protein [Nocardioides sp. Iso805N]